MSRSKAEIAPSSELIHAFFDSAVPAIRLLERQPGFRCDRTLQVLSGAELESATPEQVAGRFFFAAVTFVTPILSGEMSYGDRELYLNLIVGRTAPVPNCRKYGLWEWANALGASDERADGASFVADVARVRRVAGGLGDVLAGLWPRLAQAGPEVFAAMDTARVEVQRAFERDMEQRAHATMASEAARAFRRGDYARAVRLLESRNDLTPAEQAKLRLARKYLE
jgi:hypothetical protein